MIFFAAYAYLATLTSIDPWYELISFGLVFGLFRLHRTLMGLWSPEP